MATACLTGFPAFTSALMFDLNAFGDIDLISGIVFPFFDAGLGQYVLIFLDRAADLQQDGFVLLGHALQFGDAGCDFFSCEHSCLKCQIYGFPRINGCCC